MESGSAGFCRQFATTCAKSRRCPSSPRNSAPATLQMLGGAEAWNGMVDLVGLTIDVIGKRTADAVEHATGLILSALKIATHPLPPPMQRSVLFAVAFVADSFLAVVVATLARYYRLCLHVFHPRAGKHSFGPGHVSTISADVDCANGLAIYRVQRHDPDRIATLIVSQSVARAVEARSGFVGNMTGHLKRTARIEIQPRSLNGRAFARAHNRAGMVRGHLPILNLNFADPAIAASIIDQNSPRCRLRIAVCSGHGDDMINSIAVDVHAHDTKCVVSAQPLLRQSRRDEKHECGQRFPHVRD